jgi:AcrR family transcriptional regulator
MSAHGEPAVGRRRRSRIEEIRRGELIDAAIRIIDALGFDRTTVKDIAAAADAATGSVHYYFKTKDDLLRGAFVETERRFQTRVSEHIGDVRGLEKLLALIDLCFPTDPNLLPAWNVEIDLWQQAARHSEFRALFEEANRPWAALIEDALREAVADGQMPAHLDSSRSALELAALIDGLTLYCRVTDRVTAEIAAALLTDRVAQLSVTPPPDRASGAAKSATRSSAKRSRR